MARTPARREPQDLREEARAHLGARQDLGPEYEDEIVDSFVQKVEKIIDARIKAKLSGPGWLRIAAFNYGGEGGIRTHETGHPAYALSRRA